jgi:hypothetical protein
LSSKILPTTISEAQMAGGEVRTIVLTVAIVTLLAVGLYMVDPTMCGMVNRKDGFMDGTMAAGATASMVGMPSVDATSMSGSAQMGALGMVPTAPSPSPSSNPESFKNKDEKDSFMDGPKKNTASFANKEGFANLEDITGPADFGATPNPNGCYPRDQLTPGELLPKDGNSTWAQQNPMGTGSLKGKNFLSAGALVGVNTVGQSLRNANQQLRSEPPNPQVPVSVFFNSTIEPDTNRRDMEIA